MNKLRELKGQNGILIVFEDFLEISRKSFGGFMSQGGSIGSRRYYYKDIASIEYKIPTIMANGYLKILASGTLEENAKVGILSSSLDSMKDQNTVVFRSFSKKNSSEVDSLYKLIMSKLSQSKQVSSPGNNFNKIDELKKLGELKESGILTEEEFNIEKGKILNG